MNQIIFRIEPEETFWTRTRKSAQALDRGEAVEPANPSYSFPSIESMDRLLTAKRWKLLQAMMGQKAMSIRALARRVGRDIKAVHGDVQALLNAGVIEHAKKGDGIIFPYDQVHVDFTVNGSTETAKPVTRPPSSKPHPRAVHTRKRAAAKRAQG